MKYLNLLRVKHYIKNLIIFAPIFFNGSLFIGNNIYKMIISYICFSLVTSAVYIINDIHDKDSDSKHFRKRNRPIASNQVSIRCGYLICFLLLLISSLLAILSKIPCNSLVIMYSYLIINILYTYLLKNIPYVEILVIILNFIIRIIYGASIFNIRISLLLYITVISLSLYLILGKRRNEIIKNGINARKVLKYYDNQVFNILIIVSLILTIVSYLVWTILTNYLLILSIPIVIFALIRYNRNIFKNIYDDPTEIITSDYLIIVLSIIWILINSLMLY